MAVTRDRLRLFRRRSDYVAWPNGGGFQPIEIHINGRPLLELVRDAEIPLVAAEAGISPDTGLPEEAMTPGGYLYLPASMAQLPSRQLLDEPDDSGFILDEADERRGKAKVLGCTCGVFECWFIPRGATASAPTRSIAATTRRRSPASSIAEHVARRATSQRREVARLTTSQRGAA
jgi:hypothetical protein